LSWLAAAQAAARLNEIRPANEKGGPSGPPFLIRLTARLCRALSFFFLHPISGLGGSAAGRAKSAICPCNKLAHPMSFLPLHVPDLD
jgi:hypothetical protein